MKNSAWVTGFADLKSIVRSINQHAASAAHKLSVQVLVMFSRNRSVDAALEKSISDLASRWTEVLTIKFDLLRELTSLGLPLQGHSGDINDPNSGPYLRLLRLI